MINEFDVMWKEEAVAKLKILSWHFRGRTEEKQARKLCCSLNEYRDEGNA